MSRARGSDVDEATLLRQTEVEASYRSAQSFGQDELISPVETRDRLLRALERALYRRQGDAGARGPHRHHALTAQKMITVRTTSPASIASNAPFTSSSAMRRLIMPSRSS